MASHAMNASSSRAHSIFTLTIESIDTMNTTPDILHAKLCVVDLAGSERQRQTKARGDTFKGSTIEFLTFYFKFLMITFAGLGNIIKYIFTQTFQ